MSNNPINISNILMAPEKPAREYASIANYHIGEGSIIVTYTNGYGYLYNSIKPGISIVDTMIELAKKGASESLSDYIQQYAGDNYYLRLE